MRYLKSSLICFFLATILSGLMGQETSNPPAPGFNLADSDPEAIRIADQVMEALGGRKNWDKTRYLKWNFFGKRRHTWDRYTGNYRLEAGNLLVLMNLNRMS